MKLVLMFFVTAFIFLSCVEEVKIDPDKAAKVNPTICFQVENDVCGDNQIPMPSDFMYQALPQNSELNLSDDIPFTIAFTADIDETTLKDKVIVLQDGQPYADVNVSLHPNTKNILIISPKTSWPAYHRYTVLLLKGIKSANGKEFVETPAFYYAKSKESLIDKNNKSVIDVLDDEQANKLEALRLAYKDGLNALEAGLKLDRDSFLMLWNVTLKENFIACFLSKTVKGCEQFDEVPVPSDFVMKDGHLNLPLPEGADESTQMLINGINMLDGWGVTTPFYVSLSEDIDEDSLKTDLTDMPNVSVMVLKLTPQGGVPVAIEASWISQKRTISMIPANGDIWREKSTYVVVLTDKLKSKDGYPLIKSTAFSILASKNPLITEDGKSLYLGLDDEKAQKLEAIRLKMVPLFDGLEKSGLARENISLTYTVTTQSVTDDLKNLALLLSSENSPLSPNPVKTQEVPNDVIPYLSGQAGIDLDAEATRLGYDSASELYSDISYIIMGKVDLANYLSDTTKAWDPEKIPMNPTKETVNFYMTLPFAASTDAHPQHCDMPENGFPVIIVQHGLGGSKEHIFGFANKLAQNCYVAIAIDAVEHGERSTGESGQYFFSANMFASRDNLRQSALDLIQLKKAIDEMGKIPSSFEFPDNIKIDSSKVSYFGISLGGIIGTLFTTVSPDVSGAVLNVPGGGLIDILMMTQTPEIKDPIVDALREKGIVEGTPEFDKFLFLGQLVLDRGDPIAYAHHTVLEPLATDNFMYQAKDILIQKANGDEVIPNYTTDHLAKVMGIYSEENTDNFKTYNPQGTYGSKHSFTGYNEPESQVAKDDFISFYKTLFANTEGGN